jgi:AcrR family transcriptional regulator
MLVEDKKIKIIKAAIDTFGLYGYKKTSMQDIADKMDISRPALYQYYKNKEAVFIASVEHILQLGEQAAEAGFNKSEDIFETLLAGILDMDRVLFEPIFMTEKGKELLILAQSLAPKLMDDFDAQFLAKIIMQIDKAQAQGQIDLSTLNTNSTEVAQLLLLGIEGIKHNSKNQTMLDKQTCLFLTVFWRGLVKH